MKWYTIVGTVLAAADLLMPAAAKETCKTVYASTSIKKVPTSTTSKTTVVRSTYTAYASSTETLTETSTFTVTIGSTTSTVPTPSDFTPINSASSYAAATSSAGSSSSGRRQQQQQRRRDAVAPQHADRNGVKARRSAASSSSSSSSSSSHSSTATTHKTTTRYPHSVGCTTVRTRTHTETITSTIVYGAYVGTTTTQTTHVPTATAYAVCGADNVIASYHGHDLGNYAADHSIGLCFTNTNSGSGQEPCMSAEACCAAAQQTGYSGWQFTNHTDGANTCTILAGGIRGDGGFLFYSGTDEGQAWFGNIAPGGDGVFGGPQPHS